MYARSGTDAKLVLTLFVLAATPALAVSAWNAGHQVLLQHAGAISAWRLKLLQPLDLPLSADDQLTALVLGLSHILPLLLTACAVSFVWALLFANVRHRSLDPGWLMTGLIYTLLLPMDISLLLAAVGISFAAVLGQHIFGGTGRYIASPAVLGALFIQFSYPGIGSISNAANWDAAIAMNTTGGVVPGFSLGIVIACAVGAALLVRVGTISWRTLLGGALGVAFASVLAGLGDGDRAIEFPWYWHLMLGYAPICLAFVISDPTTSSLTRGGRWLHGMLFGVLLVAIRVLDPTHPEASLFAALLATLSVPLIDFVIIRRRVARAQGGLRCRA